MWMNSTHVKKVRIPENGRYPATVGADYTIRDYRITVSETKVRSEMELIVLGIAEGLTFVD